MALETGDYIDDLVQTNPVGSTDTKSTLDDHIRLIKKVLLQTFPNLTGPMTSTQTELNLLDGFTGTASDIELLAGLQAAGLSGTELGYVNGVTSAIQTQLDGKLPTSGGTDLAVADGGTGASTAAGARTNLGFDGATGVIQEGDIDWANAGGLTQGESSAVSGTTTTSAAYENAGVMNLYVPAGANSLQYTVYSRTSGSSGIALFRLKTSTNNGSAITVNGDTDYWDSETGTLTISDKSGWTQITAQGNISSGAASYIISNVAWRIL